MNKITAYRTEKGGEIKKGNPSRNWMDFTSKRFAYGCLPLIVANELGWDLINQSNFRAIWNGDLTKDAITIEFIDAENPANANVVSHFGHGVLTFHPNFLFKTEQDVNLIVKGIPNLTKDAIQALEGVVETDWLPLTFTMNWKFTRPNTWVEFIAGDPIARLLPYPRNYIEQFNPKIELLSSNKEIHDDFHIWNNDRKDFRDKQKENPSNKLEMEKNYFQGIDKNGDKIDFHQRKIIIKDFSEDVDSES